MAFLADGKYALETFEVMKDQWIDVAFDRRRMQIFANWQMYTIIITKDKLDDSYFVDVRYPWIARGKINPRVKLHPQEVAEKLGRHKGGMVYNSGVDIYVILEALSRMTGLEYFKPEELIDE